MTCLDKYFDFRLVAAGDPRGSKLLSNPWTTSTDVRFQVDGSNSCYMCSSRIYQVAFCYKSKIVYSRVSYFPVSLMPPKSPWGFENKLVAMERRYRSGEIDCKDGENKSRESQRNKSTKYCQDNSWLYLGGIFLKHPWNLQFPCATINHADIFFTD